MIIDTHVHVYGFPSLQKLETEIRSMEDAIAFRTRYPELYAGTLTDDPVDISDDLITHMDSHGIDKAVVQARAGNVNSDTGIITWDLKLSPGEQKKLTLKYNIKFPKGEKINQ